MRQLTKRFCELLRGTKLSPKRPPSFEAEAETEAGTESSSSLSPITDGESCKKAFKIGQKLPNQITMGSTRKIKFSCLIFEAWERFKISVPNYEKS